MAIKFITLIAATLVWGVVVWVARRAGAFRSDRARRAVASVTGWWLGAVVVSGAFALVESPAWWWVRNAMGDVAYVFGAVLGWLLAGHYFDLRRAAGRVVPER